MREKNGPQSQSHTLNEALTFFPPLSYSLFPQRLVSAKIIPLLVKLKAVAVGCFRVIMIHFRK